MSLKSNPTPSSYVALVSSNGTGQLLRLNLHLRSRGVDARYSSDPKLGGVIRLPPEQKAQAAELRDAWLLHESDPQADYVLLRELEGEAENV